MKSLNWLYIILTISLIGLPLFTKAQEYEYKDTIKGHGISPDPTLAEELALWDALIKVEPLLGDTLFLHYVRYYEHDTPQNYGYDMGILAHITIVCAFPFEEACLINVYYRIVNKNIQLIEDGFQVDIGVSDLLSSTFKKKGALYEFLKKAKE